MKVDNRSRSSSIAFKFFWHVEFKLNHTGRPTHLSQLPDAELAKSELPENTHSVDELPQHPEPIAQGD